jgi:23S rRNA pseudouridine2605 synthase
MFLTNDGEFSLHLTHPRYGKKKHYRVTVVGRVESAALHRFEQGIEHSGETLKAESARLLDTNNTHSVVDVILTEGKNREIRRLFESQNILVERLERRQIGPIKLGELRPGRWRTLTEPEIKSLLAPR